MKDSNQKRRSRNWLLFVATIIIVFFLGLLASSVMERRAEAVFAYTPQVEHAEFEPRNEIWGKNFPREYQSYLQSSNSDFRSKYNGSYLIDMLEVDPRLVVLWAGYGFAKDYNQGRGHYYAVSDLHNSLRTGGPVDDEEDYELAIWAGVIPISYQVGEPIPDERNLAGIEEPAHVRGFKLG